MCDGICLPGNFFAAFLAGIGTPSMAMVSLIGFERKEEKRKPIVFAVNENSPKQVPGPKIFRDGLAARAGKEHQIYGDS